MLTVMHSSVLQLLLELVPSVLQSLASCLDIVDGDTDVTKALSRVLVAVVRFVRVVILRAVVVRQLDDTLSVRPVIAVRGGFWRVIGQEVEIELVIREGKLVHLRHAQVFVELDRFLGVLDYIERRTSSAQCLQANVPA